jgi:hypothetical protein
MAQPHGFQWPRYALFVPHLFPRKHRRIKIVPPEESRIGHRKDEVVYSLEMRVSSPHLIRFGLFEVDTRSGELHQQGSKVSLQEQPFQVLTVLLERPGEVVTREELNKRLWPENTFVDFDIALLPQLKTFRQCAIAFGRNIRCKLIPWLCYRSRICLVIRRRNTSQTA